MEKVKISQDTLYRFILDHNIKLVRLSELTGLSEASINVCFKHYPGSNGVLRSFSDRGIYALNKAIRIVAEELRERVLTFGSSQTFTNNRGSIYDPALVEPIKEIGEYLNLTAMVKRVLGWSPDKKGSILVTPSSKVYGNITKEDADRINAELLSIVGVLSSCEVVTSAEGSSLAE